MNQYVIGIDYNETNFQIAVWRPGQEKPESLTASVGVEDFKIPANSPDEFLKKSSKLLRSVGKMKEAAKIVFSVESADQDTLLKIRQICASIGIPEEKLSIQSDKESFASYVMNQAREIHMRSVALFSFEEENLYSSVLIANQRRLPALVTVLQEEEYKIEGFGALDPEEKDARFLNMIRKMFDMKSFSSVFLMGEGFSQRWYEKSLPILCSGRRVFAGSNLYAMGACFKAAQLAGEAAPFPYLYFGEDKISFHVGLKTAGDQSKGNGVEVLIPAGKSWYDASASCEAFLYDEPVVDVIFTPLSGGPSLQESIRLEGLPDRPPRTTRLEINLEFLSADVCKAVIRDMGFGELFPGTDLKWTTTISLSGQEN